MATTFSTPNTFQPFTKIRSADVNANFTAVSNRFNWDGTANTGLGDDNIQSNTVSGGGLTRATKLKAGTASHVLINDGSGLMSSEAQLATSRGGTGQNLNPATAQTDDVIKVAAGVFTVGATPTPAPVRMYTYYNFS
jgi:hypothetical protein